MKDIPPGSLEARLVATRALLSERAPFLFGHGQRYTIEGTFPDRVLVTVQGRARVVLLDGKRADRVYDVFDPLTWAHRALAEGRVVGFEESIPQPADSAPPSRAFLDTAPLQFARTRFAELMELCGPAAAALPSPRPEQVIGHLRFLPESTARPEAVAYLERLRGKAEALYRRAISPGQGSTSYALQGMNEAVSGLPGALAALVGGPPYHYTAPVPELVDLATQFAHRVYESEILAHAAKP